MELWFRVSKAEIDRLVDRLQGELLIVQRGYDTLAAALAQARTLIISANALMPSHGLLAEEWDSWRRDADKWLADDRG